MKEVNNFKRKELFDHYNECDNPFIIVTIPIKVTNIVNFCKNYASFYATMGYVVTKTVNEIEEFKYRYIDGKFYYCDRVDSNYTQMKKDDLIGFFDVTYTDDYNEYMSNFIKIQDEFLEGKEVSEINKNDIIWMSTAPWFTFNSLVTPFNKKVTIPQFIWDKYTLKDNEYYLNLMIMIHHGFVDGYNISKFVTKLEENIDMFKNIKKKNLKY